MDGVYLTTRGVEFTPPPVLSSGSLTFADVHAHVSMIIKGWSSTSTTVTTTTVTPCAKDFWREKQTDKECTACSVLPSRTQESCGQDELLVGDCGDDSNTWKCEQCTCDGGEMDETGVCVCPEGMFKDGRCGGGSNGFVCKSCERESPVCNTFTQYRIGECGNNEAPYNTWDCHTCYIAGTRSKSCSKTFEWRSGTCKEDGEFACEPQPTCNAGEYYKAGKTTNDQATCEACPEGSFISRTDHRNIECLPHKPTCDEGEHMAMGGEPTASTDLLCSRHTECSRKEYEVTPPSTTSNTDRVCADVSDCAPGSYMTKEPTRQSNRECGDCDGENGFSDRENRGKCTQVGFCYSKNELVIVEQSRTANLECGPCPDDQVQTAIVPHRSRECSDPTTTITATSTTSATATTTTMSATTTTTTSSVTSTPDDYTLEVIATIQATYEKVALQTQECYQTIGSSTGKRMYCSTAENCYDECGVLEALATSVANRLEAVRSGGVTLKMATAGAPRSGLEPDAVPPWCKNTDVNCYSYGVTICSTSEASLCNLYCGCSEEMNTDASTGNMFDSSQGGDVGAPADSMTTVIVIATAVVVVAIIIGAAVYVTQSNSGGGGGGDGGDGTHGGIITFENPMYDVQQQQQYGRTDDAGEDLYDDATFTVGGLAGQSNDGYMDVEGAGN